MSFNKKSFLLLAVLFVAFALRLPGVFWGMHTENFSKATLYHPDEIHLGMITDEFLGAKAIPHAIYTGFSFQVSLLARLFRLTPVMANFILCGRFLSLFYGILTVWIIFLLSKVITDNENIALIASAMLAFSGLHITHSHYATTDAGNVFWIYVSLLWTLYFHKNSRLRYLILASMACGLSISFKFSWIVLPSIFFVLWQKKSSWRYFFLCLACVLTSFFVSNGVPLTSGNVITTFNAILNDNINTFANHNRLLNPIVYLIEFIPAVSFPVFILAIIGFIYVVRKHILKRNFYLLVVAIAAFIHAILICLLDVSFPRHLLPIIPFIGLLAAFGIQRIFRKLPSASPLASIFIAFLCLYLLFYAVSQEYFFVRDTRAVAQKWIIENIPTTQSFALTNYADLPQVVKKYPIKRDLTADFIVMHESEYSRYRRNEFNPFTDFPPASDVYHGSPMVGITIQSLFLNKLPFSLIKKFEVRAFMPETFFYKALWGTYPYFIGDVLIFKKN